MTQLDDIILMTLIARFWKILSIFNQGETFLCFYHAIYISFNDWGLHFYTSCTKMREVCFVALASMFVGST